MHDDNYYSVLGVSETATLSEIKVAYRTLLKKIHPDTVSTLSIDLRRKAEAATKDIIEAYSVLSDPDKRRQYDRELGIGEPAAPPPGRERQWIHRSGLKTVDRVIAIGVAIFILAALLFLGALLVGAFEKNEDSVVRVSAKAAMVGS